MHPGYGFLAENPDFADACRGAGLTFVGPSADVIALMGGKTEARKAARRAGVPVVPGTDAPLNPDLPEAEVAHVAAGVGYPLFVKAVAGGGGKGMRLVHEPGDLASALRLARSEAASAFGDASVYFERQLSRPRHIEVQLLGDEHGTVVPFVERECSIQRRHQKIVEEAPSMIVSPERRAQMATPLFHCPQCRVHECRHRRVSAGRDGRILFSGDEHAAAGRARHHRGGDAPRFGTLAVSHRTRGAAHDRTGSCTDASGSRH